MRKSAHWTMRAFSDVVFRRGQALASGRDDVLLGLTDDAPGVGDGLA